MVMTLWRPPRLPLTANFSRPSPGGRVLDHLPGPGERLPCAACGNLTRFDVVASRRTTGFWHYTVAGELTVEDEQDLAVQVEEVRCRGGGPAGGARGGGRGGAAVWCAPPPAGSGERPPARGPPAAAGRVPGRRPGHPAG